MVSLKILLKAGVLVKDMAGILKSQPCKLILTSKESSFLFLNMIQLAVCKNKLRLIMLIHQTQHIN